MKRQTFRLASVLRYYVLQKQKTEFELQKASRILQDIEVEIACLEEDIAAVAELVRGESAGRLTISGWIACYRKAESLDRLRTAARQRQARQREILTSFEEQRKRWSIAEETLLELRRQLDRGNQAEAAKAQQVLLDETVLRRWLDNSPELEES
jgi:hypothetical protein